MAKQRQSKDATRRPIKARSSRLVNAVANRLVGVGFRPNGVSMLSMVFAAGAGTCLLLLENVGPIGRVALLLVAALLIQIRLLCNVLDGLMAIEGGFQSKLGELYNDLPDRVSDAVILIGAGYAARATEWASLLGWLAALLAILTAYVRVLGAAAGAGHDFRGPMAKPHRMAVMTAACVIASVEPLWGWRGHVLIAALAIICIGSVITIARRLHFIVRRLESDS